MGLHIRGKELQRLFKENGSFESMEIVVSKKHKKINKTALGGGWYSRHYLEKHALWSKTWPQLKSMHMYVTSNAFMHVIFSHLSQL